MTRVRRFVRFNAVGALGIGVQLATIAALVHVVGADYVVATIAGVSAAVAHNFIWHVNWTWRDRTPTRPTLTLAFERFALANRTVSMAGNLVLMTMLVGMAGIPPIPANIVAIVACGVLNFELGDRIVC